MEALVILGVQLFRFAFVDDSSMLRVVFSLLSRPLKNHQKRRRRRRLRLLPPLWFVSNFHVTKRPQLKPCFSITLKYGVSVHDINNIKL